MNGSVFWGFAASQSRDVIGRSSAIGRRSDSCVEMGYAGVMAGKQLLFSITRKDFVVEDLTSGGKGGQHANRSHTRIRITHPPSGATGESADERSQYTNKQRAFERLANSKKFRDWHTIECARRMGKLEPETPEQIRARVDRMVDEGLEDGSILIEES
jgi:hypothetical protein